MLRIQVTYTQTKILFQKGLTQMTNKALQVTNFDFYGENLIALQDNATGEIYTAINSVLRGIGFTERQVRHQYKRTSKMQNNI